MHENACLFGSVSTNSDSASMLMRVCFRVLPRWPLTVRVCRVCLHLHVSQVMQAHRVQNLVFSSSATVYGDPQYLPIDEQHPVGGCTNPYGKTKYFIEEIIKDHCKAEKVGKEEKKTRTAHHVLLFIFPALE